MICLQKKIYIYIHKYIDITFLRLTYADQSGIDLKTVVLPKGKPNCCSVKLERQIPTLCSEMSCDPSVDEGERSPSPAP